jgi:hypothetical protein
MKEFLKSHSFLPMSTTHQWDVSHQFQNTDVTSLVTDWLTAYFVTWNLVKPILLFSWASYIPWHGVDLSGLG